MELLAALSVYFQDWERRNHHCFWPVIVSWTCYSSLFSGLTCKIQAAVSCVELFAAACPCLHPSLTLPCRLESTFGALRLLSGKYVLRQSRPVCPSSLAKETDLTKLEWFWNSDVKVGDSFSVFIYIICLAESETVVLRFCWRKLAGFSGRTPESSCLPGTTITHGHKLWRCSSVEGINKSSMGLFNLLQHQMRSMERRLLIWTALTH